MNPRRVVITGVGAVCALGNTVPDIAEAAKAGRSGGGPVTRYEKTANTCQVACEVKNFDAAALFGRDAKKLDIFCQYGVAAANEAVADSGLDFSKEDPARSGVITGSGMGGLVEIEQQHLKMLDRGAKRISPHFITKLMINA
ncbi:MAG: beta-ketoacyl synthase N-terminal-like domain-containing protein, partial [Planctomycetota bacterium]|nr:beta-ketoacyl synthase N-terminal-like domain-containing protein [Planctomycetota bacterium]